MTIEEIKSKVSIVEFIKTRTDLDFKFARDGKDIKITFFKTKNGQRIYEDGKPIKLTSIIVSRLNKENSLREIYFGNHSFEKGKSKSIIDFVSEFILKENTVNFKKCTGIIYEYMNSANFVSIEKSSLPVFERKISENKASEVKIKMDFPSKATFDYLKSRKIPDSTYGSPLFLGTFGSYTHVDEEQNINIIDKPCFPLITIDDKLQTLQYISSLQPERTKKFVRDISRLGSMYTSQKQKGANTIIIAESPEKNMAHYALYKKDLEKYSVNPVYKSPCGNMTHFDVENVVKYAQKHNLNKYILAFDNDKAGKLFTLQTILGIRNLTCSINQNDLTKPNTITLVGVKDTVAYLHKILGGQLNNTELLIKDNIDNIISKLETKSILTHSSISKDFLDDLNDQLYLPKKFDNTSTLRL